MKNYLCSRSDNVSDTSCDCGNVFFQDFIALKVCDRRCFRLPKSLSSLPSFVDAVESSSVVILSSINIAVSTVFSSAISVRL